MNKQQILSRAKDIRLELNVLFKSPSIQDSNHKIWDKIHRLKAEYKKLKEEYKK